MLVNDLLFQQKFEKRNVNVLTLRFFLLSIACLFVLSACQSRDSAEFIFDNYLYRLSNSLQVDDDILLKGDAFSSSLGLYPSRRKLQKDIPRININLLDFLRLSECELQRHIGQRNGGLGRVMEATQQLIYDATFIALAEKCLSQLEPTSILSKTLTRAYDHKRQYLPSSIWNASFASNEFAYLFSLGAQPLSLSSVSSQPLQLTNALKNVTQKYESLVQGNIVEGSIDEIETYYQIIESSKRIGELRLSLQSATGMLQQADKMLAVRIKQKPLCRQQRTNSQFTIVNNVFHKYYIGQVQPYIAGLHKQSADVFLAIDVLVNIQKSSQVEDAAFIHFWEKVYRNTDSEWALFNRQVKEHTLNWQALLTQCGKLPS